MKISETFADLTEKCAVFGVFGVQEAAKVAGVGLLSLQHRGQEGSGIVASNKGELHRHADAGLVVNVYTEDILSHLQGNLAIGHNRYSTSGSAQGAHLQPVFREDVGIALAHNGNLPLTDKLDEFLTQRKVELVGLNDSEKMTESVACYMRDGQNIEDAIIKAFPLWTGAFSIVATDGHKLVAFRDECGLRPLSIGSLNGGYVVASETCALDAVGAEILQDVEPGEMIVIDDDGLRAKQLVDGQLKIDAFEFVYFSRPDSILSGRSVYEVRERFGAELAERWPVDADIVVSIPNSGNQAAIGYSKASGIPLELALIKNPHVNRTFIEATQQLRQAAIRRKLSPVPAILKDKKVILVDDSIVRGNTIREVIRMVREAGASEIHVRISSPPVFYPDFYGIDMPEQDDLIAYRLTPEDVRTHLGADSLGYLPYDGMVRAIGLPPGSLSTACFNGVYPISIGRLVDGIGIPREEWSVAQQLSLVNDLGVTLK